ncbi:MAG: hypothetical protein AB8G26_20090, partial [Ilumatobacter sp.]
ATVEDTEVATDPPDGSGAPDPADDATREAQPENDQERATDDAASDGAPSSRPDAPSPPNCAPGSPSQYTPPAPFDDEAIQTNQIVSGQIEEFTADVWRIDLCEGQVIFLDSLLQCRGADSLGWRLIVPDGDRFFSLTALIDLIGNCSGDTGPIEIDETGTWTIEVFYSGYNEREAEYKFEVLNVAPPDVFDIELGQEVRVGDPGPGAGQIEFPGSVDAYRIDLVEGQRVFFDAGDSCEGDDSLTWRLVVPDGDQFFRLNPLIDLIGNCGGDTDPITIDETGRYTVEVLYPSDTDRTASEYSFTLVDAGG